MSLTVEMRQAFSALINHGEQRLSLPPGVIEFVSFLNDGYARSFGLPMDEHQAVMAFMTQAWTAPDTGRIESGSDLIVRPSGVPATFVKDGFQGVSIVKVKATGQYMIAADSTLEVVDSEGAKAPAKPRRTRPIPEPEPAQA